MTYEKRYELSDEDWEEFIRILEEPHDPNPELADLMKRKPLWEKE